MGSSLSQPWQGGAVPPPVGFNTSESAASKVEHARKQADDEIENMRRKIREGLKMKQQQQAVSQTKLGVSTGSPAAATKESSLDLARHR